MKFCNKCKVSVNSPVERCPLCYATLSPAGGEPEIQDYPDLQEQARKYHLIYRILLAISLAISVVCLTINLLTYHTYLWSLIVIANIFYMWAAIGTALRRYSRLGYVVFVQALSFSLLMFIIDQLIEPVHWALNYAVPFCFITATLSITIITIVKRMRHREFILYFILTALLGFSPLLLLALGLVTVLWPSIASAVYSGLSLVGIFIFADTATKIELRKRFHF